MRDTPDIRPTLNGPPPGAAQLLMLDAIAPDLFRAQHNLDNYAGAVFGGQLLAQAMVAAAHTASDWPATQASGIFLRGGRLDLPLDYAVECINDGRRFAQRRVIARQEGRNVLDFHCSFHQLEAGPAHQFPQMGDVPAPETLSSIGQIAADASIWPESLRRIFTLPFPVELRPSCGLSMFEGPGLPARDLWMRIPSASQVDGAAAHQALLMLLSDYWLAGAATAPHAGLGKTLLVTSLNHAIWLHAPAQLDQWLLFRIDSDWAGSGRGLARGSLFDRQGRLVATVMQEALLRPV